MQILKILRIVLQSLRVVLNSFRVEPYPDIAIGSGGEAPGTVTTQLDLPGKVFNSHLVLLQSPIKQPNVCIDL